MEETKFDRTPYINSESLRDPTNDPSSSNKTPSEMENSENGKKDGDESPVHATVSRATAGYDPATSTLKKKSYFARLKVIESENLHHKNYILQLIVRPFYLFSFPIVVYAGFIYGANIVWLSVLNATESMVLSNPPYNMSSSHVGLTFIAPLIGTTLAYAPLSHFLTITDTFAALFSWVCLVTALWSRWHAATRDIWRQNIDFGSLCPL